jgi:hypothetical protein
LKREKRLTKKEKKAAAGGPRPAQGLGGGGGGGGHDHHHHIHCTACGVHLDESQFGDPPEAVFLQCDHGSSFAACVGCADKTRELLAEHDRTGQPVKSAELWH